MLWRMEDFFRQHGAGIIMGSVGTLAMLYAAQCYAHPQMLVAVPVFAAMWLVGKLFWRDDLAQG